MLCVLIIGGMVHLILVVGVLYLIIGLVDLVVMMCGALFIGEGEYESSH